MFLLDREISEGIYKITVDILKNYFFYDTASLTRFADIFVNYISHQYVEFDKSTDRAYKLQLKNDSYDRKYFTSYFLSFHLHDILVDKLHFSELELDCFENILPKFMGESKHAKQTGKRANY
jgi:hypothetical protein